MVAGGVGVGWPSAFLVVIFILVGCSLASSQEHVVSLCTRQGWGWGQRKGWVLYCFVFVVKLFGCGLWGLVAVNSYVVPRVAAHSRIVYQVHLKIKAFKCSLCDYGATGGSLVRRHIRLMHKGQVWEGGRLSLALPRFCVFIHAVRTLHLYVSHDMAHTT